MQQVRIQSREISEKAALRRQSKTKRNVYEKNNFTVEYTYNSNAIEGNTLTLRETDLVLRGLTIDQKPIKDHIEAVGHKEAFDYVCELVRDNIPLNERVIKQIHYLVLADKKDDRGVYRRIPVHIMGRSTSRYSPISLS